jgi:hypothetical protein
MRSFSELIDMRRHQQHRVPRTFTTSSAAVDRSSGASSRRSGNGNRTGIIKHGVCVSSKTRYVVLPSCERR